MMRDTGRDPCSSSKMMFATIIPGKSKIDRNPVTMRKIETGKRFPKGYETT